MRLCRLVDDNKQWLISSLKLYVEGLDLLVQSALDKERTISTNALRI